MNKKQPYYYLKTDNGTKVPTYKHSYLNDAKIEAKRLMKVHNCKRVEVLMCVSVFEKKEVDVPVVERKVIVEETEFETTEDLPF